MSRNLRVLVVDDDINVCRGARLALERAMSCEVIFAQNGRDALHFARTENPDVILLDILMPGMSGGQVAEALSESPLTDAIPIVFLTGLVNKEDVRNHDSEIGGRIYVAKPASVHELVEAINQAMLTRGRRHPHLTEEE